MLEQAAFTQEDEIVLLGVAILSGQVQSGLIGNAAVVSGSFASGQIFQFHFANAAVTSGVVASGIIGQMHIASGGVNSGHLGNASAVSGSYASGSISWPHLASGAVQSGGIANAAVNSGNVASGSIGTNHLASGVLGNNITSGQVQSGHVGNNTIVSGGIASGQLFTYHFASGTAVTNAQFSAPFISGTAWTATTAEVISGVRAVSISQSGRLQIAMASVSGRMPAVGVVFDSVASGIPANVFWMGGLFQTTSGMADYSGFLGQGLYVGRSGHIVTASGSWNSGGFASGDIILPVGVPLNSGGILLEFGGTATSGQSIPLYSGQVQSGNVASGAVAGSLGGGALNIASGTVGPNELGSGAIRSGHIGSGAVGLNHLSSGLASGLVQSGGVGSGSLGWPLLANAAVLSGNVASGALGALHHASGSILSGHAGSGVVLGANASGARHIASGTIGTFDLGSGVVSSGQIASGAILDTQIASGAVVGGAILAGGQPMVSGAATQTPPLIGITAEIVSGPVCVGWNQSGALQIAMASVSGRMPAIGVALGNALSGTTLIWSMVGGRQYGSGVLDFSGFISKRLWVGRSGQIVSLSGSWGSGGFLSGDLGQVIGMVANSGGIWFSVNQIMTSGGPLGIAAGGAY